MYPRKVILAVLGLLLLGGAVWFAATREKKVTYLSALPEEQVNRAKTILERDADHDGLKDWEEELWETDAKNQDTDSDGTTDGEEVRAGRNPLVKNTAAAGAAPNDPLDREAIAKKTTNEQEKWTETDRFSREFFRKYLALKQSGKPLTAEDEQRLIDDVVGHYPPSAQQKIFSETDLSSAPSDDAAAYRVYGNALGAVILKHREKVGENELEIFERALGNDDETELAALAGRAERYGKVIADILAIPAPREARLIHLAIANALEQLKESVAGMSEAMRDPVRALGPAVAYPQGIEALADALDRLGTLLSAKGARFEKNEAGHILTE